MRNRLLVRNRARGELVLIAWRALGTADAAEAWNRESAVKLGKAHIWRMRRQVVSIYLLARWVGRTKHTTHNVLAGTEERAGMQGTEGYNETREEASHNRSKP